MDLSTYINLSNQVYILKKYKFEEVYFDILVVNFWEASFSVFVRKTDQHCEHNSNCQLSSEASTSTFCDVEPASARSADIQFRCFLNPLDEVFLVIQCAHVDIPKEKSVLSQIKISPSFSISTKYLCSPTTSTLKLNIFRSSSHCFSQECFRSSVSDLSTTFKVTLSQVISLVISTGSKPSFPFPTVTGAQESSTSKYKYFYKCSNGLVLLDPLFISALNLKTNCKLMTKIIVHVIILLNHFSCLTMYIITKPTFYARRYCVIDEFTTISAGYLLISRDRKPRVITSDVNYRTFWDRKYGLRAQMFDVW